jgi:hypothetical protein
MYSYQDTIAVQAPCDLRGVWKKAALCGTTEMLGLLFQNQAQPVAASATSCWLLSYKLLTDDFRVGATDAA